MGRSLGAGCQANVTSPPWLCSLRGPQGPLLWPACSEALALSPRGSAVSLDFTPLERPGSQVLFPQPGVGAGGLSGLPERPHPPSLCLVSCCSG